MCACEAHTHTTEPGPSPHEQLYLSTSAAVVSSESESEGGAADLAHRDVLVGYHNGCLHAKLLFLFRIFRISLSSEKSCDDHVRHIHLYMVIAVLS